MKIKIKADRRTGQISADYHTLIHKTPFRTRLIKRVIENAEGEVVVMVDTNQCVTEVTPDETVNILKSCGIEPEVLMISANPQKLLGFSFTPQKKRASERLIMFGLHGRALPDEALAALLPYDIAVGIGPSKTLHELGELMRTGTPIYGSECFKREMYDSILCTLVRSSFDIRIPIKETMDEMGL